MSTTVFTPKRALGYYVATVCVGLSIKVPIYGLRAVPTDVLKRVPDGYANRLWQVEVLFNVYCTENEYVWINEDRRNIFLY